MSMIIKFYRLKTNGGKVPIDTTTKPEMNNETTQLEMKQLNQNLETSCEFYKLEMNLPIWLLLESITGLSHSNNRDEGHRQIEYGAFV